MMNKLVKSVVFSFYELNRILQSALLKVFIIAAINCSHAARILFINEIQEASKFVKRKMPPNDRVKAIC